MVAALSSACATRHHNACKGTKGRGHDAQRCECQCHHLTPAPARKRTAHRAPRPAKRSAVLGPTATRPTIVVPAGEEAGTTPAVESPPGGARQTPTVAPLLPPPRMEVFTNVGPQPGPIARWLDARKPKPSAAVADGRPACYGSCYEGSSACDNCGHYNPCRRETR